MKQRISAIIGLLCFIAFLSATPESYGQKTKSSGNVTPSFSPDVPTEVRNVITTILEGYHEGNGTVAALLVDASNECMAASAFVAAPIPIIEPKISMVGTQRVAVDYGMPHPGTIIKAVLQAGTDVNKLKRGIVALSDTSQIIRQTEQWAIIRDGGMVRLGYGGKGIFGLVDHYGSSLDKYVINVADWDERKLFWETPYRNGYPMPIGTVRLIEGYFWCFNLEDGSREADRTAEEIIALIEPDLREQTAEIVGPTYSLPVP